MVDLPTGKMKSREGTVVDADDLMNEVIAEAKETTQERGRIENLSITEKEQLYQTIGMGGLKYYLLKVDPKKRMQFNPAESIELNGNTGPFIQYAHARIQSLLAKVEMNEQIDFDEELPEQELTLIKQIKLYKTVINEAAINYSPALLANYLYELVKLFNHFYQSIPPIVKEENTDLKQLRIHICKEVARVIAHGMHLLGIDVPDRM
jgi:arginyl-tRNA synthetase